MVISFRFALLLTLFGSGCLLPPATITLKDGAYEGGDDTGADTGAHTDTDGDPYTGDSGADTGIEPGGDSGSDSGSNTDSGSDSGSTGFKNTYLFEDFGDGGECSASPFTRSDAGSLEYVVYAASDGIDCGIYLFGGGSATGPVISLDYSSSGYDAGRAYGITMTFVNLIDTEVVVYADFGGGDVMPKVIAPRSTATLEFVGEADAYGRATLRVWSDSVSNYDAVLSDLRVMY